MLDCRALRYGLAGKRAALTGSAPDPNQLDLFADPSKDLLNLLRGADLDGLSPRQAMELLREWKEKFK